MRKVGCGLPSGGLVNTVQYAKDVCGSWCQRLAHASIMITLLFSFCFLIVWGSSAMVGSAVLMASRASCLALLNSTKGATFGSQLSLIPVSGWARRILSILSRHLIDVSCFSWELASSTLLIMVVAVVKIIMVVWRGGDCAVRKSATVLSPSLRACCEASASVIDSPKVCSAWLPS
jgi:hypothetical protein